MEERIEIPDGVEVEKDGSTVTVSGDGGDVRKTFDHPHVDVTVEGGEVVVSTGSGRRSNKAIVGTFRSHIRNMIEGVQDGYTYKLKAVYAHFPMSVKTENNKVVIQNFIGERSPRKVDILEGVSVNVDGEDIEVTGPDKEKVAQTAANIEQKCNKGTRDQRRFQDGVYITSKGD